MRKARWLSGGALAVVLLIASSRSGALDQYGRCARSVSSYTMVHTVARNIPSPGSALVARVFIDICNSAENSGTPTVKCSISGTPISGTGTIDGGNPGEVLKVGDCVHYAVSDRTTPQCISDTASTMLTVYECM